MPHVVILGSGTPNPEPGRGGSAVAVADDEGEWVLIDCGRAATQRAIDAGLDLASLVAVLLTHHHSDHISDLATLATARWTAGAGSPLVVVAPDGPAASFAERCLDPFDQQAFYSQAPRAAGPLPTIAVHRFDAPAAMRSVHQHRGWEVAAATVDHHPVEPSRRVPDRARRAPGSGQR